MPTFIENIDVSILRFFESLDSPIAEGFFNFTTLLGEGGLFWIVLSLAFLVNPDTRKIGVAMCVSLLLSLVVTNLTIKPLVARVRPYELYDFVARGEIPSDFSFPSGHTSISFAPAAAFAFAREKGKMRKFSIFLLALAALIGLSRLYLLVHYPSDVLAGALIGLLCGFAAAKLIGLLMKKFPKFAEKLSKEQK